MQRIFYRINVVKNIENDQQNKIKKLEENIEQLKRKNEYLDNLENERLYTLDLYLQS